MTILLVACGTDQNHGYGWEYDFKYEGMRIRGDHMRPEDMYAEYLKVSSQMGDKHPPFVIFDTVETCGVMKHNPPLIVIDPNCPNKDLILRHELVHYFGIKGHPQEFDEIMSAVERL